MKHDPSKRELLRMGLAAGAATALPIAAAGAVEPSVASPTTAHVPLAAATPAGAEQLTAYHYGGQVLFRWNNHVIAAYRANPEQKYPYFSDLAGPVSGIPLTTESSLPYPHHRGLWLGCDPLHGGDFWKDSKPERGQIVSTELSLLDQSLMHATLSNACQWQRPGKPTLLSDERSISLTVIDQHYRAIDFDIRLTALENVRVGKAKHSLFAIRVSPDLSPHGGGTLVNAEGLVGEAQTFGKPTRWCDYSGRRTGRPDVVEGIAVMDHPDNPWAPCPWFTRDYGHLSPSPFNFLGERWKLPKGESIRMRYRVVMHAGPADTARLNELFESWATPTA